MPAPTAPIDLEALGRQAREGSISLCPALEDLWDRGHVQLRLGSAGGGVSIQALIVSDFARESAPGAGGLVMQALCSACDRLGAPMELLAKPLPKPHASGSPPRIVPLSKLVGFYLRHGFHKVPGHPSMTSSKMRRAPRLGRPSGP